MHNVTIMHYYHYYNQSLLQSTNIALFILLCQFYIGFKPISQLSEIFSSEKQDFPNTVCIATYFPKCIMFLHKLYINNFKQILINHNCFNQYAM